MLSNITREQYFETRNNLKNGHGVVKEHIYGSRRTIYIGQHENISYCPETHLQIGQLTKGKFRGFLGAFSRALYKSLRENPELMELIIPFEGLSKAKNYDYWAKMKLGADFYNIDLSSAYWQMAHRLGYINSSFFMKYLNLDEYKEAKRYCISFLARENKMLYEYKDHVFEIECNTDVFYRVYNNIRHELYNCIAESISNINTWIEYNIDGVMIPQRQFKKVCSKLDTMGLYYKIKPCIKISDNQYTCGNKLKKFQHLI